jgi:hypothetical protein
MDKKKISGLMTLAIFLSAFTTYEVTYAGTPYLCKDTGIICIGERLSSTGKTCYYQLNGTEKSKQCTSSWEIYKNIDPKISGETYICSSDECIRK